MKYRYIKKSPNRFQKPIQRKIDVFQNYTAKGTGTD